MLERIPKYTLRKLSVGLASVMIGSGILMSSPKVLADTNADTANAGKSTNTDVQPGTSNQNEDKGNSENQSRTSVPDDTHSTGTDVQPGTSNQNEGKVMVRVNLMPLLQLMPPLQPLQVIRLVWQLSTIKTSWTKSGYSWIMERSNILYC
ncbi:YSIRK-type signal peptide-containing protein [Lactobacillus crispatus]|uniref:YSIRK-type signal peptide-containing protein n=1 Tax=Lactobacillus crispatus TaxID=47770 RepID=UPI001E445DF7|nr:YSIRK-type signal peptide-containing protein [Lactobacillus crispatus]